MSSKADDFSGLRRERNLFAGEPSVLKPERSGFRRESNGRKLDFRPRNARLRIVLLAGINREALGASSHAR